MNRIKVSRLSAVIADCWEPFYGEEEFSRKRKNDIICFRVSED